MDYYKEIEKLTIKLVNIPSINNTTGERDIADYIAGYLKELDYFKKHPEYLWEIPLKDDRYRRKNVIALLRGEKGNSKYTVILHGHTDTVGVEDFGNLVEFAFDPIKLEEKLKEIDLPDDVKKDLDSGEWMFGRGVNDMKSGVATHLILLKKISQNIDKLDGNILFMANPVEENQHTGIIESLDHLEELKNRLGLEYKLAINNDFTTQAYSGDPNKYVYLGAVGKLLPCFYIVGKETHVGQCYHGLDPNLISAELLKSINLNADLCDEYEGEYSLPPAALKMTDLKTWYNVQTPLSSFMYFNYFTHDISVDKVMEILKGKAYEAFIKVLDYHNHQHKKYCDKTGLKFIEAPWKPKVMSYEELYNEVKKEIGKELDFKIAALVKELVDQGTDARLVCLKVVETVHKLYKDNNPVVIVFFAPPYCPHNTIKGKNENEREILSIIEETVNEISKETGEKIKILKFFPSLSDSSYIKMDDDDVSLNALINNFPEWHTIYPVPVKKIRDINIPAANFGTYGKDAHKWTERVHKKFTFEILPNMIERAIKKVLIIE